MRIILGANHKTCIQYMRSKLILLSLSSRKCFMRLQLVYKIINNTHCSRQLEGYLVRRPQLHDRTFRDSSLIDGLRVKTKKMGQLSFKNAAARDWNSLPRDIRDSTTLKLFKSKLFHFILNFDEEAHVCSVR